jgi:hypothetical protein
MAFSLQGEAGNVRTPVARLDQELSTSSPASSPRPRAPAMRWSWSVFGTVVLHELSHALTAKRFGATVALRALAIVRTAP